jgi:acetyl esterase/lipase
MPQSVRDVLSQVGPVWGTDLDANIRRTREAYLPILAQSPKSGVSVVSDVSYGPDARHKLDIYRREGLTGAPVVAFLHGGAYTRGERNINAEAYSNVSIYFARHGMLAVNATYRLAPAAQWPSAAEDVGALVKWLRSNAAAHGGDPRRIYLVGHSAGATHIATYAYIRSLQPPDGPGIAGMVLMSGRYRVEPKRDDPRLQGVQAYFGTDPTLYPQRSALNYVKDAPAIPTFIVICEYENPGLDTQGALLLSALCERDGTCPRFTRLEHHNHSSEVYQFNTADEALGREILEFVRRGR